MIKHDKNHIKPIIKNGSVLGSMAAFSSKPLGKVCILDGPLSLEVPLALKGAPGTMMDHGPSMAWKTSESAHAKRQIPAEDHQTC